MAANVRTEMRIATRTAPHPSGQTATRRDPIWSSSNDIFEGTLMAQPIQRKKPPPRPPPPKFNQNHMQYQRDQKPRKPARPTELLTNFFGRKKQEGPFPSRSANQSQSSTTLSTNPMATTSLIDLSPPGSPTFTTRSSSDGVSIDSFGSDGNSNPSAFTSSSGNTSQTESAFEDDFDFFGMTKKTAQNDPWQSSVTPRDPFALLEDNTCPRSSQAVAAACFLPVSCNTRVTSQVPSNVITCKPFVTMPTIIRARPPKPPAPKLPSKKFEPTAIKGTCDDYRVPSTAGTANTAMALNLFNEWPDYEQSNSPSPPMPTIPPPAPPVNYLVNSDFAADSSKPHGIALYDFPATHPDDLALQEGNVVQLMRKINDDWLEGRIRDRRGIFPLSFIDIKVPLPGMPDNVVTALYAFPGENSDDLSFEKGAKITVISRISEDWLYGEYNGRKGQFPVNYVNRLPRNT